MYLTAWHLRLRQYYPGQEVINEHNDPNLAETPQYKEKQTILPHPINSEQSADRKTQTPVKRTHDGKLKKDKKDSPQINECQNSHDIDIKEEAKIDMRKIVNDHKSHKKSSSTNSDKSSSMKIHSPSKKQKEKRRSRSSERHRSHSSKKSSKHPRDDSRKSSSSKREVKKEDKTSVSKTISKPVEVKDQTTKFIRSTNESSKPIEIFECPSNATQVPSMPEAETCSSLPFVSSTHIYQRVGSEQINYEIQPPLPEENFVLQDIPPPPAIPFFSPLDQPDSTAQDSTQQLSANKIQMISDENTRSITNISSASIGPSMDAT